MKILLIITILFSTSFSMELISLKKKFKSNIVPVKIESSNKELKAKLKKRLKASNRIKFSKKHKYFLLKIENKKGKIVVEIHKKNSNKIQTFKASNDIKSLNNLSYELIKIMTKEDKKWLNKNFYIMERTKNKETELMLYDVTGQYSKKVYKNGKLNIFVKQKNNTEVYFTMVEAGNAELIKLNLKTGKKEVLHKSNNGYLIVSDIYKNKILFTKLKKNGTISIFIFNQKTLKTKEVHRMISEMNISPKFSRKNSNEIYYISVRNKKFEIRLVNLVKQTNRLILKKDSLRQIDINENDDLLISYYNKKKKKYDISLYNRYTMNNEIKLTSVGNNIYPFFLEKTVILYLKGNKSNKQATILDLKTGETLMFESSISGNIQSVSY